MNQLFDSLESEVSVNLVQFSTQHTVDFKIPLQLSNLITIREH